MTTLTATAPEDRRMRPCDPDGDETEDIPGIFFCIQYGEEYEDPAHNEPRPPRTVRIGRQRGGSVDDHTITVAGGFTMVGPFDNPNDPGFYDAPAPTGPVTLAYPAGADDMKVAVLLFTMPR